MRFRLVLYSTNEADKYLAEQRFEYLGDRFAIWHLWNVLVHTLKSKHVEVFNLAGGKQRPEDGLAGLSDYNV